MTVGQVLSDAGCQRMRDRFIPRMTEHDFLVTGTIKTMRRLLAIAARLLVLVESLALRHRDVHTVRRAIRLNPSRSLVSAPFALIHANDPVLAPSGPNPLVMLVRHLLLLGVTVCMQDLFVVAIHLGGLSLLAGSLWRSSLTGFSGSMAVVTISALWRALVLCR